MTLFLLIKQINHPSFWEVLPRPQTKKPKSLPSADAIIPRFNNQTASAADVLRSKYKLSQQSTFIQFLEKPGH